MTLLRSTFVLAALVLTVPAFAYADEPANGTHEEEARKYPMPAAEFRAHVNAKTEHARARLEEHIMKKSLSHDDAEKVRARFNAAVAQVNAKVDEVCADGTVTRDEAIAVHELAKSLHHPHKA